MRNVNERLLSPEQLKRYSDKGADADDFAGQARALLRHQREHWPLLSAGFQNLENCEMRSIEFEGYEMKLQFNPGRITSSSAKVDMQSISERTCFLCQEHLPPEQKGLLAGDYMILGNPYPIFKDHITISYLEHTPQLIRHSFDAMLDLSGLLGESYSLIYNGPKCGASAPDHLHFQGGEKGFMPIDDTLPEMIDNHGEWIVNEDNIRVAQVDDGLRRYIVLESDDKRELVRRFEQLYDAFYEAAGSQGHEASEPLRHETNGLPGQETSEPPGNEMAVPGEPMLNIITARLDGVWRIIIFLRKKHRPSHYYLEGDRQILFSPAAVDFGGVCITPRRRDFERLTAAVLRVMFNEVSATRAILEKVAVKL